MAQTVKKNSKVPLVSVVMSVYNGEKYLREAINSILNQTFTDFEFIIINDGSTDDTLNILKSYRDPRIVLISRDNKGLVVSLNEGIEKARGKYIARMDADDVSLPNRLAQQTTYLKVHPEAVLVGAGIMFINERGRETGVSPLLLHDTDIKLEMLVRCPVAHPVVLFRKSVFDKVGGYRQSYFPAEDYDLWCRFMGQGEMANCDDILLKYRELNSGISSKLGTHQKMITEQIRLRAVSNFSAKDVKSFKLLASSYEKTLPNHRLMLARLTDVYMRLAWRFLLMKRITMAVRVMSALVGSVQGVAAILRWLKAKVLVS